MKLFFDRTYFRGQGYVLQIALLSCLITLLGLPSQHLCAQLIYSSGYIIKADADTSWGEIAELPVSRRAELCKFRENKGKEVVVYGIQDLLGYGFEDGPIYSRQYMFDNEGNPQTLFLEQLVDGSLQLYWYREMGRDYFFLQSADGPNMSMVGGKEAVFENERAYVLLNESYRSVLRSAIDRASGLWSKINSTPLKREPLVKLVRHYQGLVDSQQSTLALPDPNWEWQVGLLCGLIVGRGSTLPSSESAGSLGPRLGLMARWQRPYNMRQTFYVVKFATLGRSSDLEDAGTPGPDISQWREIGLTLSFGQRWQRQRFEPFYVVGIHSLMIFGSSGAFNSDLNDGTYIPMLEVGAGVNIKLSKGLSILTQLNWHGINPLRLESEEIDWSIPARSPVGLTVALLFSVNEQ